MRAVILFMIATILLGGCTIPHEFGKYIPKEKLSQIHVGMDQQQVVQLIGLPTTNMLLPTTGQDIWVYDHIKTQTTIYGLVTQGSRQSEVVRVTFSNRRKVVSCTVRTTGNEPVTGVGIAGQAYGMAGADSTSAQTYCDANATAAQ